MLYDRGLQTPEEIDNHNKFMKERALGKYHGCISSLICDNCKHLISDSICLCCCIFTCPNCGFQNGQEILKMRDNVPFMKPLFEKIWVDGVKIFLPNKIEEDYSI